MTCGTLINALWKENWVGSSLPCAHRPPQASPPNTRDHGRNRQPTLMPKHFLLIWPQNIAEVIFWHQGGFLLLFFLLFASLEDICSVRLVGKTLPSSFTGVPQDDWRGFQSSTSALFNQCSLHNPQLESVWWYQKTFFVDVSSAMQRRQLHPASRDALICVRGNACSCLLHQLCLRLLPLQLQRLRASLLTG